MKPKTRKEREVWQALLSLQDQGLQPDDMTGEVIADRLLELGYNRGSNSDLYRFKRTWLATQQSASPFDANVTLMAQKTTLPDPITQAAVALRETLRQEAKGEIEKIKQDTQETLNHTNVVLHEVQQQLSQAQQHNQTCQQTIQQLEAEKAQLLAQYHQEKEAHQGTQARELSGQEKLTTLQQQTEAHLADLKRAHQQTVDALKQQHANTLVRQQQETDDYKTLLETQRQQHLMQLHQSKEAKHQCQQQLNQSQTQLDQKTQALETLNQQHRAIQNELATLKKGFQEEHAQHERRLDEWRTQLQQKEQQLATHQGRQLENEQRLTTLETRIAELQEALTSARETIAVLKAQKKSSRKKPGSPEEAIGAGMKYTKVPEKKKVK